MLFFSKKHGYTKSKSDDSSLLMLPNDIDGVRFYVLIEHELNIVNFDHTKTITLNPSGVVCTVDREPIAQAQVACFNLELWQFKIDPIMIPPKLDNVFYVVSLVFARGADHMLPDLMRCRDDILTVGERDFKSSRYGFAITKKD